MIQTQTKFVIINKLFVKLIEKDFKNLTYQGQN